MLVPKFASENVNALADVEVVEIGVRERAILGRPAVVLDCQEEVLMVVVLGETGESPGLLPILLYDAGEGREGEGSVGVASGASLGAGDRRRAPSGGFETRFAWNEKEGWSCAVSLGFSTSNPSNKKRKSRPYSWRS